MTNSLRFTTPGVKMSPGTSRNWTLTSALRSFSAAKEKVLWEKWLANLRFPRLADQGLKMANRTIQNDEENKCCKRRKTAKEKVLQEKSYWQNQSTFKLKSPFPETCTVLVSCKLQIIPRCCLLHRFFVDSTNPVDSQQSWVVCRHKGCSCALNFVWNKTIQQVPLWRMIHYILGTCVDSI